MGNHVRMKPAALSIGSFENEPDDLACWLLATGRLLEDALGRRLRLGEVLHAATFAIDLALNRPGILLNLPAGVPSAGVFHREFVAGHVVTIPPCC